MSRPEKNMIERLGADGLARVLTDLMDAPRLVRLANACGLKYPGMRTQSQATQKIVDDLVKRSSSDDSTLKAVFRALQKETRPSTRRWNALSEHEREALLSSDAFLLVDGNLGRHLFLMATSGAEPGENGFSHLLELTAPGSSGTHGPSAKSAKAPSAKEMARLNKKVTELQKKLKHLDQQLTNSRMDVKSSKKDLIKRKGELAESRMLAERLRHELESAEASLTKSAVARKAAPESNAVEKLDRAVRRLASEQRKTTHTLGKLIESRPQARPTDQEFLTPVTDMLDRLRKELEGNKRRTAKELSEQGRRLEELRGDIGAVRKALATKPGRRGHSKGADARIGVFIDVQNMYYAARRLKGKLDFDALMLGALAGRRMIHAVAYVVESKEIDQSGFIAVLEKKGIEVRRKTLRVRADGSMKGDWDMELALDILDAANDLDVVVLVSGDGDFTSLVKRVRRMGHRVEVFGFPRNTAKSLIEAADLFQPLDRRFMIYSPRPPKAPAAPSK